MLVVSRFSVADEDAAEFEAQAADAVTALAERPGFVAGRVSRAVDDPSVWLLVTEWVGVGAWRRALGGYDVKLRASPLLARSLDEPSAFDDLLVVDRSGQSANTSDRAADASTVRVGEASRPSVTADGEGHDEESTRTRAGSGDRADGRL
jgi:hypothetical protein